MTITHHLPEDLLVGLAASRLRPAMVLPLRVHLEACAVCRGRVRQLEAVGGALLDEAEGRPLAAGALEQAMARIGRPLGRAPVVRSAPLPMPPGAAWPAALTRCRISRWHWMAPGMRWATASVPEDPDGPLFLLRIAPGKSLARHTHRGVEFTQVLCGAFDDGRAVFGPGDFDMADGEIHHQPQVLAGEECVCLAYVEDGLRYDNRLAGLVGRWIGM